ncbi:hypothetical protein B0H17DRAFT_686418 [Mycena rosella]|uniref:ATP synthase protein MI25 n=1 Tax=Mycena rosella TaxID=1033263 RepID=A0AAD7DB70_MYCRO|nr:hypothetical protein B0H17DRAFT_686418 [Mycena rosella]
MSDTHLLSATFLALLSCIGSNIAQYVVLSLLVSCCGVLLARPLLPSARMKRLEELVAETTDLLQRAIEERVLSNRGFILQIQLRLSRANLNKSSLRAELLKFESHCMQEYLYILGVLSHDIDRCRREVKEVQIAILAEMERECQLMYSDEIIILSSGFCVSGGTYTLQNLKLGRIREGK